MLVVVGVVGSILAAGSAARDNAAKSRQSFILSSTAIAATLQLAILHEQDLMFSASGFIADDPNASNQQFVPVGDFCGRTGPVPGADRVRPHGDRHSGRTTGFRSSSRDRILSVRWAPNGTFQVVPPGKRSYYCLVLAGMSLYDDGSIAGRRGPVCARSRADRMRCLYVIRVRAPTCRYSSATATYLSIQTPVYRGGMVPATVAGRRAAFLGWVGMAVMPQLVLNRGIARPPRHHGDTPLPRRLFERDVPKWQASDRRRVGDDQLARWLDGHDLRCMSLPAGCSQVATRLHC